MSERVLDDFIHEAAVKLGRDKATVIEERIRLVVQEKPKGWPEWLYRRLLSRLLRIEVRRVS